MEVLVWRKVGRLCAAECKVVIDNRCFPRFDLNIVSKKTSIYTYCSVFVFVVYFIYLEYGFSKPKNNNN